MTTPQTSSSTHRHPTARHGEVQQHRAQLPAAHHFQTCKSPMHNPQPPPPAPTSSHPAPPVAHLLLFPSSTHSPPCSPLHSYLFIHYNASPGGEPSQNAVDLSPTGAPVGDVLKRHGVKANSESCGSHSNALCLQSRQSEGLQSWIYALMMELGLEEHCHAKALFFTTSQIYG